jgi:hypothetical protein
MRVGLCRSDQRLRTNNCKHPRSTSCAHSSVRLLHCCGMCLYFRLVEIAQLKYKGEHSSLRLLSAFACPVFLAVLRSV